VPRWIEPGLVSPGVFVHVNVHDSVTVDLFAAFRSGAGAAPPSTLSVRGTAVQPTVHGQGFWTYEWHEVFPSSSAPSQLQVTTPIVQGSSSSALSLVIPIARREDPMDVTVAFGDDLRLHVSPLVTPPPPLTGDAVHWTVILQQTSAVNPGQVFVSGNDAYRPSCNSPGNGSMLSARTRCWAASRPPSAITRRAPPMMSM
jgi:hypothetical protein